MNKLVNLCIFAASLYLICEVSGNPYPNPGILGKMKKLKEKPKQFFKKASSFIKGGSDKDKATPWDSEEFDMLKEDTELFEEFQKDAKEAIEEVQKEHEVEIPEDVHQESTYKKFLSSTKIAEKAVKDFTKKLKAAFKKAFEKFAEKSKASEGDSE